MPFWNRFQSNLKNVNAFLKDAYPLFSFGLWQEVEIDIELAPGDQTAIPKSKEQAERDAGNQLHMLTNRHDKFLDSLREVKVKCVLLMS